MRLAVHEVAPAAHELADDDAHARHVEQDGGRDLLDLCNDEQRDGAADDAAVDGKSALPDVEDGDGIVGVELPVENAVVQPRADNADGHGPEDHVEHVILRDAEVLCAVQHIQNGQQKAAGNDDAVPVDILAEDGKGHGARVDRDAEIREGDGRSQKHGNIPPYLPGQTMLIAARAGVTVRRRKLSASRSVTACRAASSSKQPAPAKYASHIR